MKLAYVLLALGISIFGYVGAKHFLAAHKRDKTISLMTKTEAQVRKFCASDKIGSRIECMEEKFQKLAIPSFPTKFSITKNGQRTELETSEEHSLIKIKRTADMSFGGSCMSSFYYFDFDDHYVFISKDNLSGVIFCQSGKDNFTISSSELSEDSVKKEVKTLTGLSL